jgi:hypothetical protein
MFCAHKSFGLGGEDELRSTVQPIALDGALLRVRILSMEMECRICCVAIPHVLTQQFPLQRLKLAAPVYPSRTPFILGAIAFTASTLCRLVLKMPESWRPARVLRCLAGCTALEELFVSFYDLSRKADVMVRAEPDLLDALAAPVLPALHTLDMCLSPLCLMDAAGADTEIPAQIRAASRRPRGPWRPARVVVDPYRRPQLRPAPRIPGPRVDGAGRSRYERAAHHGCNRAGVAASHCCCAECRWAGDRAADARRDVGVRACWYVGRRHVLYRY